MIRLLHIFIILSFSGIVNFPQNNQPKVTVKVFSNLNDSTDKVYIAGNNKQLGNWQPDSILLNNIDHYWERTFNFAHNTSIEFKFTKGSWENEALDENGKIPPNHSLKVVKDTTLMFNISHWKNKNSNTKPNNQITGNLIYHKQMRYDGLLPRDVIVWLPPNYFVETDKHYPVLYMNDGQNLFDPSTSFTKTDWQLDETADSLIRNKIIEPVIIVGIYNTKDREEEYSPTSKGVKYMLFVVDRLKPFIDSTYRTLPERENTAVGGSSMGGLASLMLAWNFSAYFSKAACFSPAFKYDNFDYTEVIEKHQGRKKDITLYIYNGGKGVENILQPGVDKMIEVLQKLNFKINEDLFIKIDSTAEHTESAWAKRAYQPFKLFFPKNNSIDEDKNIEQIENLEYSKRDIRSNRFRIQGTTASTLQEDDFSVNLPALLNLNYRMSNIDSTWFNKSFLISFSTEVGANIFFNDVMILPYVKIGPEFRFFKSFYFDFHAGGSVLIPLGFVPFYFYGSEIGYIFNKTENFSFELELGVNGIDPFYLYYFAFTFSF